MRTRLQATNHMFMFDTSVAQRKWVRKPNGPMGASLAFFTMQLLETDGKLYVHGGVDFRGTVKGFLWAVQVSNGDPSWALKSLDGPPRTQHCSSAVGGTVFVWGGVTGWC